MPEVGKRYPVGTVVIIAGTSLNVHSGPVGVEVTAEEDVLVWVAVALVIVVLLVVSVLVVLVAVVVTLASTVKLEGTPASTVVGTEKAAWSTTLKLRTNVPVPRRTLAPVVALPSELAV